VIGCRGEVLGSGFWGAGGFGAGWCGRGLVGWEVGVRVKWEGLGGGGRGLGRVWEVVGGDWGWGWRFRAAWGDWGRGKRMAIKN
jgi:hypothetical protein